MVLPAVIHYPHNNPLHPSVFPSITHLPKDLDSYAITKWVTTGYWPWMKESSPPIPANTPAKLVKTTVDEAPIPQQPPPVLKRKRSVTPSEDSTLALYPQFQHFFRDADASSKGAGSEEGEILETTTRVDEAPDQGPSALKRKWTVSSASSDLDQELIRLTGDSSISSERAAGGATEERPVATTESLAISAPTLGEGEIEEESPPPALKRRRTVSLASSVALDEELLQLAAECSTASESAAGDATETPEVMIEFLALPASTLEEGEIEEESEAPVLQAAAPTPPSSPTPPTQSLASRRCMSSALGLVSLTSDFTDELALGMCVFFHFSDNWSVVGNTAAGCHCPIPGTKGLRGSRAVDVTGALIDGKGLSKLGVGNGEEGGGGGIRAKLANSRGRSQ